MKYLSINFLRRKNTLLSYEEKSVNTRENKKVKAKYI